jgi:hypothetical protein
MYYVFFDKTTSGEPCARLEFTTLGGPTITRVCPYGKKFNRTGAQAKQILLKYINNK